MEVNRRKFLISSALGTTSLIFSSSSVHAVGKQVVNLLNPASPLLIPPNFEPAVWFTMESNGRTTIHIIKAEMGQHIGTTFAQVVAEELELDWSLVQIDYPEMTAESQGVFGFQMTGGSTSTHEMFDRLARTGAVARELLIEAGSEFLAAEPNDCEARNSVIVDTISGESITYSEILSQTAIEHKIIEEDLAEVSIKTRDQYKIVGKPQKALDIPEKVNGKARYGIDAYVPNMVYGKIITPPTRFGSAWSKFDDTAAKQIDGYITTVPIFFPRQMMGRKLENIVISVLLVIAKNFPAAMRAAELVKVEWTDSPTSSVSSESFIENAKKLRSDKNNGVEFVNEGSFSAELSAGEKKHESAYETSLITHASLEPQSAVAQEVDGVLNIYGGHQGGHMVRFMLANFLQTSPDKIVFHPHFIGGSFGSRIFFMPIVYAAVATRKLKKPVKVIFTREDEMALQYPRTSTYQHLEAVYNEQGLIRGFKHDLVGAWHAIFDVLSQMPNPPEIDTAFLAGSDHWYDIPNQKVTSFRDKVLESAIAAGAVRSVGNNHTVFAIESFIDEVAHKMDRDPLVVRLNLLTGKGKNTGSSPEERGSMLNPTNYAIPDMRWQDVKFFPTYHPRSDTGGAKRLANVLRISTGIAGYGTKIMPKDSAQGISITAAENRKIPTFCACTAEVQVNRSSGDIDVKKLTVAIDVGIAVNPDGVRAQVEGALLWGLSATLFEEITLVNGGFKEKNFDEYKWQTMDNLPELDIQIVQNGLYPSGVGEPATSVVAPAITNAVYNAVGARIRRLPIRRKDILENLLT